MGATVTVACKLPHGLHLQLYRMADHDVPVMGGGVKTEKRAEAYGPRVTIRGVAHPQNEAATVPIIGGYALTHGVDAEFMEFWLEANASMDLVRNKLIFVQEKASSAEAQSREQASIRSGLEPLDPKKPPRGVEVTTKIP